MTQLVRAMDVITVNLATRGERPAETYTVGVVGFTRTERLVLDGILGLSARRDPGFIPFTPKPNAEPDLFVVDADDARCAECLREIAAKSQAPVVMVGASALGTDHFLLPKPLRYASALKMLELAMRDRVKT